jgi:hypothetical protein
MLNSFFKYASGRWSNTIVSSSDPLPVEIIGGGSGIKLKIGESDVSSSNPLPAKSVNCVIASDGVLLPVDSLEQTLTYTGDLISTISVSFGSEVYIQTYTYTSSNVTSISQWEKQ